MSRERYSGLVCIQHAGAFVLPGSSLQFTSSRFLRQHHHFYSRQTVINPFKSGIYPNNILKCRSRWPRGLRRRSAAARLLRLWVRIPPEAWKFVCCECCVLSGRGLCDGLITRPEESYRLWCVVVCDLETSWMRWPWPTGRMGGCRAK